METKFKPRPEENPLEGDRGLCLSFSFSVGQWNINEGRGRLEGNQLTLHMRVLELFSSAQHNQPRTDNRLSGGRTRNIILQFPYPFLSRPVPSASSLASSFLPSRSVSVRVRPVELLFCSGRTEKDKQFYRLAGFGGQHHRRDARKFRPGVSDTPLPSAIGR